MAWRRSNVWTLVSLGALVELQAYPSSATTAGGDPFLNTPGIQLAQPSETPTAPRVTKATDLCGKNCAQVVATILSVSECSSYIWSGGCPNVAPLTGFTNSSTLAELCPLECGLASMAHDNRRLQATTTGCTGSFYEDASSSLNGLERPPAGTAGIGSVPRSKCTRCARGFPSRRQDSCVVCQLGHIPSADRTTCTRCPAGQYAPSESPTCSTCSFGFETSHLGDSCQYDGGALATFIVPVVFRDVLWGSQRATERGQELGCGWAVFFYTAYPH